MQYPYSSIRTSRRTETEARIDLRKRRRWWADNEQADAPDAPGDDSDQPSTSAETKNTDDGDAPETVPYERFQQVNQKYRQMEAEVEQLRQQQAKAAEERKVAEQKRLEEQGKWQEIAQQRQTELEALTPLKDTVEKYEAALRTQNEARMQDAPEVMREMLSALHSRMNPLEFTDWLNENADKLKKPHAPNLNGGQQSTGNKRPPRGRILGKRRY